MVQRAARRGGRVQHYYVSPVRYTTSAGGDDPERWAAQLAGFLYVVAGAVLSGVLLLPLLGFLGSVVMMLFAPLLGVLGVVTVIPSDETWILACFGMGFVAVGLGILARWRIAHLVGILVALAVFVPALWAGPPVGGFLVVALWRGQKRLPWPWRGRQHEPA